MFQQSTRMNIGILLLGQKFKNLKLVGTTTDNGKKQLWQYCHQQRVLNNQTTVRRFSNRFFAKQGTWLVSLLYVLPKENIHYQVYFGI